MEETGLSKKEQIEQQYSKYTVRKILFIVICLAVAIASIGFSVTVGGRTLSFTEVYEIIYNHIIGRAADAIHWNDDYVVWNLRVPRAIFAIIAGAGLAVSGACMQSVMKNPLADPFTTGISSGASLGVAVSAVIGFSVMNGNVNGISVIDAFVFALIPMIVVIFLAPKEKTSPATLILAGTAISYLFNSLTTIILSFTDSESLANIYSWEVGTLTNITWDCIAVPLIVTIAGSAVIIILSRKLNILALGDKQATALGVNVENLRIILLALVSLIVASIIAYAGIIGFVGLVSPHIVRMILGSDNRFVVPGAAMFGAAFMLGCDIITRLISPLEVIPVGIIVSFIGAPIFLYLIVKQSKSMW